MQDIFGTQLEERKTYLQGMIQQKRKELEGVPEGKLRCKLNRSRQHTVLGFEEGAPEFYTKAGLRVRSKSEIIIAERLDDLVLPYIFEFPVYLPDRGWVFPDFTILNVRLRKAYLWEHLGRMDDPGYLVSNISKLKSYEKEGYYMGDNLIVTFETKDSPIDTRQVDRLIKHFLM